MVMLMIVPNKTYKFNYCENLEKLFFFVSEIWKNLNIVI